VTYYHRFVKDFAKIAKTLTLLLGKNTKFMWENQHQNAFETLINSIVSSDAILQFLIFKKEFHLSTDASDFAIGAVLSQEHDGIEKPIWFASRSLSPTESKWSTSENEFLAIVWGVKFFRPYLYGQKFKILTDHIISRYLGLSISTNQMAAC